MMVEPQEALTGVGKTALGVAYVRALESLRPDRLFNDPYARAFLDAAPGAFSEERAASGRPPGSLGAVFYSHCVIRTRFFDDYLLSACAVGCRPVVLLAAGLDARAFRLGWPEGVRLFELDLPGVLAFKELVLAEQEGAAPRCGRFVLAADLLREDWPAKLTGAGFDPARPTAWLAEGLLVYLSADEAAHLLTAVGELSATGSRVSFERGHIGDTSLLARARAMPSMERYTSLWKGGLGDTAGWLARRGWRVETHEQLAALAASYGRAVPDRSDGGFLTAVRERR